MALGSNAIYMGDRWRPDLLGSSRYIWLPLDWSSGTPTLVQADVWSINLSAGRFPAVFFEKACRLTYCLYKARTLWRKGRRTRQNLALLVGLLSFCLIRHFRVEKQWDI